MDIKGESQILSRLGVSGEVDFLVPSTANVRDLFAAHSAGREPGTFDIDVPAVACLLVDEA